MSQPLTLQSVSEIVCSVLESSAFQEAWVKHYPSLGRQVLKSETADIRAQIDFFEDNPDLDRFLLDFNPDLFNFLHDFVDLQRRSFSSSDAQKTLLNIYDSVAQALDFKRPKNTDHYSSVLPKIIKVLERETGQKEFCPAQDTLNLVKHIAQHAWKETKEHYIAVPLLSIPAALSMLVALRLGTMQTVRTLPEQTAALDMDINSLLTPEKSAGMMDPALFDLGYQGACHSHIQQIAFGHEPTADFMMNTLHLDTILGQHCAKLDTYAHNAKGWYDWYNTRLGYLIENPAAHMGQSMDAMGSVFQQAYLKAVERTADGVYVFNTWENLVVHGVLMVVSLGAGMRLLNLKDEERTYLLNTAGDFLKRTTSKTPLSYVFGIAGAAHALAEQGYFWSASQGLNPQAVLLALGGAVLGATLHKLHKHMKRAEFARAISAKIPGHLTKAANEAFNPQNTPALKPRKTLRTFFKNASVGAMIGAVLSTADFHITGGQATGQVLGAASVIAPYLVVNGIEDGGFHVGIGVVFGTAGVTLGLALKAGAWPIRRLCKALTTQAQNHNDLPPTPAHSMERE